MSPDAFARIADLHRQLAAAYTALAQQPEAPPLPDRALTLDEAAAMLGMTRAWLGRKSNWAKCGGYLDVDRRLKFSLATLEAHVRARGTD